jgi:DNA-binding beta-propeller fold protein YncE
MPIRDVNGLREPRKTDGEAAAEQPASVAQASFALLRADDLRTTSMTTACAPPEVTTSVRARYLGAQQLPAGQVGSINGLAVDDRYVYATWHRTMANDGHDSPADGELVVLDQQLLADPVANPVVARIGVGRQPRAVAIDPGTRKIYVLNGGQQGDHPYSLSVIRWTGSAFALIGWISIGGGITDVAVNPRTHRVYVSNWAANLPGAKPGLIHVIDGTTDQVLPSLAIPVQRPLSLAFDPATETLYAALFHAPTEPDGAIDAVAAISCGRDGSTHTVQKVVSVPAGSRPHTVAVSGGRLYLANMGNTPTGPVPPNLTRFELDGSWASRTVPTAFGGPVALAPDPGAGRLYVTTNAGFQAYDLASESITAVQQTGPFPQSVVVDAAGRVHLGDAVDGQLRTLLPVVTTDPLGEHWTQAGATLGQPVSGVRALPGTDPRARYQVFEHGAVFASTNHGAVTVSRPLVEAWEQLAPKTRALLGPPVEPSSSGMVEFRRGRLVLSAGTSALPAAMAFVVLTEINACWTLHRLHLGEPIENESTLPDGGRRQRFQRGEVCWRSDLGAHAVWGPVFDEWAPTGATGPYGYPTEDVTSKVYGQDEGAVSWDRGVFERIAMHFPTGGGSGWILPIGIHRAHEARGGLSGLLGFPVDTARGTPLHGTYMDFQNGVAVWHPEGHPYAGEWSFSSAQMRIVSFLITGSDGFPDGDLDLFVRAVLERVDPDGTRTNILNRRFPHDGGDYDAADHTFDPPFTMELAKPLRGGHRFETMFASYDAEGVFSEDKAWGTVNHGLVHPPWDDDPYNWDVQPAYTVDNLWGLADAQTQHHQARFTATYRITEFAEEWKDGVPFRKQWWWKVNNFVTPRLTKEQYARTFADVDSSSVWGNINPLAYVDEGFEALYFHFVYRSIAEPGNCFGMSLEAIDARKDRSLFPQPIYKYGNPQAGSGRHRGEPDQVLDAGLIDAFNIKHGRQVGHQAIGWFLRLFGQGLTHNPKEVFRRSRKAFQEGNFPVLSFTRSFKTKGHTVLPFHWEGGVDGEELPDGSWGRIWIADPKHEWMRDIGDLDGDPTTDHDSDDRWHVKIRPDNSFSYDGWHGGTFFNNRMFYHPYDRLSGVPTLPSWDVLSELANGYLALVVGDAVTEQVTDGVGRNLFRAATGQPPESWDDIVPGADERIPDLVPIPITGEENEPAEPQPLLLYGEGPDVTHTYAVRGGGGTYRWGLRAPALGAVLTARGGPVADQVSATRVGTVDSSIGFAVPPGGVAKEIGLVLDGMPRSPRFRQFLLDGLRVAPKQRIAARLRDGGRELLIENSGGETSARVRVRPAPGAPATPARTVPLAAGKVTRVRPDWSAPGTAPLRVEVRDTVDGPPVRCFTV